MLNINKNHWVVVVLDFEHSEFFYGNPLSWAAGDEVVEVIDWWIIHYPGLQFVQKKLKMIEQPDWHNCRMLANNTLGHYFLPKMYPLMKKDRLDEERLRTLLKVIECH